MAAGVRARACSEGVGILVLVQALVLVVSIGSGKVSWSGAKEGVLFPEDVSAALNSSRAGFAQFESYLNLLTILQLEDEKG
jgi:hypothetical protein